MARDDVLIVDYGQALLARLLIICWASKVWREPGDLDSGS